MNCLYRVPSYTASLYRKATRLIARTSFVAFPAPWSGESSVQALHFEFLLRRHRVRCYAAKRATKSKSKAQTAAPTEKASDPDKDAFFVVRKGDVVGVYRSFRECQAQLGSSVYDPPVSVFKGYNLTTDAKNYLVSRGLKDAIYTINASDLKDDLFGLLTPCPLQELSSNRDEATGIDGNKETSKDLLVADSANIQPDPPVKVVQSDPSAEGKSTSLDSNFCIIEFDGASKGNPGRAGAGAVLRAADGSLICRLREGVGSATNNVAEYRAIILGLKYALEKGYTSIQVLGDSKLVCMQVSGFWKVRHKTMSKLHAEVRKLKAEFSSFQISHVLRGLNSEADAQANKAVKLADGQIEKEYVEAIQMT